MEWITRRCTAVASFGYRLFFTRDDDLDVLQIVYVLFIGFLCRILLRVGDAYAWKSLPQGFWWLSGAILGYLAITGVPRWAADLVARKTVEPVPVTDRLILQRRDPTDGVEPTP